MENNSNEGTPDRFVFTINAEKEKESDRFLSDSTLVLQIAGQLTLETNVDKKTVRPGDILLVRKHQFIKVTKRPSGNQHQKALLLTLKDDILRNYAIENQIPTVEKYRGQANILLPQNEFLTSFFSSLIPYTHSFKEFSTQLSILKVREAVHLILHTNPSLENFLFDFSEPHKIDLEKFMLTNYKFNVPVESFAKLTGRSLAGFKRDFKKTFGIPPRLWLQNKRLAEAHHQIDKNKKKPSAIYLELGFESLSHFSYAFKKHFGYSPSELNRTK